MSEKDGKTCNKCGGTKPLSAFYKHKAMADGHLNQCKICKREYQEKRRQEKLKDPEWVDKERKRGREKYHRLNYKDKYKKGLEEKRRITKQYREKYPEKHMAKNRASKVEVRDGFHRHHWSYREEHHKGIIPLLPELHYAIHRHLEYDQDELMYRDYEGNLLDTKEKHMRFIYEVAMYKVEKDIFNKEKEGVG